MASIVFDQYQRYRFIERVISSLNKNSTNRILEVGALGSPLRALLPDRNLILLDHEHKSKDLDIQANALHLPFSDHLFEFVICTDVLEHMKPSDRSKLIEELDRVTSNVLILGFPHFTPRNVDADRIFFDFIKNYSGVSFEYLDEHLKYGLPDAETIRKQVQTFMPEILEFKNSNVDSWVLLQLGNFILLQHPEMDGVTALLNNFFNQSLEPVSHGDPCYRTFLVCSRKPFPKEFERLLQEARESSFPERAVKEYASKLLAIVEASDTALKRKDAELEALSAEISHLKQSILYQDSTIRGQAEVNKNLRDYLNLFLDHPGYKIYKYFKNARNRLFKNGEARSRDMEYLIFQNMCEPNKEDWKRQSNEWPELPIHPSLNIVTAVFQPPLKIFEETITSVLQQTYGNWLWNVVDASKDDEIWKRLIELSARESRIKPHRLLQNGGISENMNVALRQATGDYIVVLDHDDTLAPHALFEVAKAVVNQPDLDFIYSDSDKLDEAGERCEPLFKPDWSPEMMLSYNLLNQISVFRRSLLDEVGYLNPDLDGAQDWDLYFRIMEKTTRIHHIPQILYHWRRTPRSTAQSMKNKPLAQKAQILAVSNHLMREGIQKPEVFFHLEHPIYRTYPTSRWNSTQNWKISIIIPSRDRADLLKQCLNSLFRLTSYANYEVIVVDTGSTQERTLQYYEQLKKDPRFSLVSFTEPFNFGRACNTGASRATGNMFLFLNNDTEILAHNWLNLMLQWFERRGVGIVGAKLLYPNGRIQHAGVILGFGGLAGHLFANEYENTNSIFGNDCWYRNVSAVTGACLMIPRDIFSKVGGFDESFHLIYSDVELCLRAADHGYRTVYSPDVRLIHVESATHKKKVPRLDFENATKKWKTLLEKGDPYYNPNLTPTSARPAFKLRSDESLVHLNAQLMRRMPQKEMILLPDDVL